MVVQPELHSQSSRSPISDIDDDLEKEFDSNDSKSHDDTSPEKEEMTSERPNSSLSDVPRPLKPSIQVSIRVSLHTGAD